MTHLRCLINQRKRNCVRSTACSSLDWTQKCTRMLRNASIGAPAKKTVTHRSNLGKDTRQVGRHYVPLSGIVALSRLLL